MIEYPHINFYLGKYMNVCNHSFLCRASMSYFVLKYPAFCALADPEFQSFHFCCFSLFTSSTCAFLNANFSAFNLVFLLFFTFYGSLGRILSLSGTLNYAVTSGFSSYTFSA